MSALIDNRRLSAMVAKEVAQIRRDPSTFLIAFILPLLLLFLFGYALNLDSTNTRIGIALEDSSAPALSLAGAYQNNPNFEAVTARSVQPLKDMMVSGEIRGIVVIPQDFGSGYARGNPPPVQIIADGSMPNTANFTRSYSEGLLNTWMANEAAARGADPAPPIDLSLRYWYNPSLTSRNFLVPGAIAIVMTMIGTLLTALVVAREWERGTMEAMMATPMRMAEFIASKVVPYFLLGIGSMTLCTLIAVFVFGVPFRGSPLALAAIAADSDGGDKIAKEIPGVTTGGEKCTEFKACADLLADGKDIDYDGVSGPIELGETGSPTAASIGIYEYGADNTYKAVDYISGNI